MTDLMRHSRYTLKSRFLRFFGGAYTLYDAQGNALGFAEMKRFRVREDIRLYNDERQREPLLIIRTKSVFDFSGAYDVADPQGERIGTLKRSGLRSTFMRDHWQMLDGTGEVYGELQEDSQVMALFRRLIDFVPVLQWLGMLFPQRYDLVRNGQELAHYQQHFNPFVYRLDITLSEQSPQDLDPRLVVAMAVLLAAIEGRQ